MSKDYSEAYLELQAIRTDMANVGTYSDAVAHERDLMEVARAVRVLAFHIQELMERQR